MYDIPIAHAPAPKCRGQAQAEVGEEQFVHDEAHHDEEEMSAVTQTRPCWSFHPIDDAVQEPTFGSQYHSEFGPSSSSYVAHNESGSSHRHGHVVIMNIICIL